mgnify:FL=1
MPELHIPAGGSRLLLHSCCAPCSGAIIEALVANEIRPAVFFSNSNIVPLSEYELRRSELERYCRSLGVETVNDEYDHRAWLDSVRGLEHEPERGLRCLECFKFRLRRAARYACRNGYDVLTTSLASSRWKDLGQVSEAGIAACTEASEMYGKPLIWWGQNWRKGGLQPRRNEIIHEQNFYNQTFCGCEFSK